MSSENWKKVVGTEQEKRREEEVDNDNDNEGQEKGQDEAVNRNVKERRQIGCWDWEWNAQSVLLPASCLGRSKRVLLFVLVQVRVSTDTKVL